MTYVVGWKTEKHVFLCADMAITQTGGNLEEESREHSVFGEKLVSSNNTIVRDALPKIIQINRSIMLGFAGDVSLANTLIEDLILRVEFVEINSNDDFEKLLQSSVLNCLFGNRIQNIQLIITTIVNEEPAIFAYNHDNKGKIQLVNEIVQIGSLSQDTIYSAATSHFVSNALAQKSLPAKKMLSGVSAFIQSYVLHDSLMGFYGVGGVITGAYLSPEGIKWQENTIYILYDNLSSGISLINIINIHGTILARNANGDHYVFINSNNPSEFTILNKSNLDKIKSYLNKDTYKYVSFLNKKHRQIVIVEREPLSDNSKYLKLKIENKTDISINIESELYQHLMRNQNSEKDIPIEFSFLSDKEKGIATEP